ncbi:hypothetical protein S83_043163, partial [Arachis hypogaea]
VHFGCNVISFYVKMRKKKQQVFGIPPEMRLDALFSFHDYCCWCSLRRYGTSRKHSPLQ